MIVDRLTAQSQCYGGIIMGIGMALTEETMVDHRMGRIVNSSLAEYHVPVNADIPKLEAFFVEEIDEKVKEKTKGLKKVN